MVIGVIDVVNVIIRYASYHKSNKNICSRLIS